MYVGHLLDVHIACRRLFCKSVDQVIENNLDDLTSWRSLLGSSARVSAPPAPMAWVPARLLAQESSSCASPSLGARARQEGKRVSHVCRHV